jgi:hypothetical protein
MSKFAKIFVALFLVAGAMALTPGTALAQHHHHGGHWGGHWGGWGPGFGLGFGIANPYYYGGGPYYAYDPGPNCGWVRVRVWRGDHWGFRRAWRCW